MKRVLPALLATFCLLLPPCLAGGAEPVPDSPVSPAPGASLAADPVAQELKELLTAAADRAVRKVAKSDGYAGNQAIRIGMPDELEHLPPYLLDRGYQAKVNAFILSLNRAAEKAAPKAVPLFAEALRETAFDNPRKILDGGDSAATDHFRKQSSDRMSKPFITLVTASMAEAGVHRAYREMMEKYDYESVAAFPVGDWGFDLEGYVAGRALDGLYRMMGEEEKKIREDQAAQSSELLRQVLAMPE